MNNQVCYDIMLFLFMNMQNICFSCACLSWYVFSVMIGALISVFIHD